MLDCCDVTWRARCLSYWAEGGRYWCPGCMANEKDGWHYQRKVFGWRTEAFGGWSEQLRRIKATVVIFQFGKMESFEGVAKIAQFKEAYGKLIDDLAGEGRRAILLAPSPFEWPAARERAALNSYTKAVASLAKSKKIPFITGNQADSVEAFILGLTGKTEPNGPIRLGRPSYSCYKLIPFLNGIIPTMCRRTLRVQL